jgi:hypothetical protein
MLDFKILKKLEIKYKFSYQTENFYPNGTLKVNVIKVPYTHMEISQQNSFVQFIYVIKCCKIHYVFNNELFALSLEKGKTPYYSHS